MPLEWLRVYDELRRIAPQQRRVDLAAVRRICQQCGMPHAGFTLEQELEALLGYLHALNAVLWYDTPELRDLVILDPQWLVDCATSIIRDYKLKDHTDGYQRMKELDQEAIRKHPDAWSALTEGRATLSRPLMHILWRQPEFEKHQAELIDLMVRFGLFVPLPNQPDHWLVPTLLRDATALPMGWQPPRPDDAKLRLHFSLGGFATDKLVYHTDELSAGFLPIGAFHRLCAAAISSSQPHASGAELALFRNYAYVCFGTELIVLRHVPAESSVAVQMYNAGTQGSGALVLDRLRVILSSELSAYSNLQWCILTPLESTGGTWINLDVLPTATKVPPLMVDGANVGVEALRQRFTWWYTVHCEFNFILADKLRETDAAAFPKLLPLQQMRTEYPDWIVKRTLDFDGVCSGAYVREYLGVSHRWEKPEDPDPHGLKLAELRVFLKAHPTIKYIFFDVRSRRVEPISPATPALEYLHLSLTVPACACICPSSPRSSRASHRARTRRRSTRPSSRLCSRMST